LKNITGENPSLAFIAPAWWCATSTRTASRIQNWRTEDVSDLPFRAADIWLSENQSFNERIATTSFFIGWRFL